MKIINKQSIVITLLLIVFNLSTYAQITKAEIIATGLTCSMCSNAINKQLKSMAEVESVDTDLNTNTFTVVLKKDSSLTANELKNSIEKTGFFIGSMVLTMELGDIKIEDNLKVEKDHGTYVFVDTKARTVNGAVKVKVLKKVDFE